MLSEKGLFVEEKKETEETELRYSRRESRWEFSTQLSKITIQRGSISQVASDDVTLFYNSLP